jgi:hypothetical protein
MTLDLQSLEAEVNRTTLDLTADLRSIIGKAGLVSRMRKTRRRQLSILMEAADNATSQGLLVNIEALRALVVHLVDDLDLDLRDGKTSISRLTSKCALVEASFRCLRRCHLAGCYTTEKPGRLVDRLVTSDTSLVQYVMETRARIEVSSRRSA